MRKKLLFLPLALLGLVVSGCSASELPNNFSEEDQVVETPWEDYVLPATGIEFVDGEDALTLKKGESHTYSYSILPRGATSNSLNWFSNDTNVATVENGVVTAVGGGDAIVTVSSPENAFDPVELSVDVIVPLTNFTLTIPERLDWSDQYQFDVSYEPTDTTERDLTYEIIEESVADLVSVNEQGVVTTANKDGTATLKVSGGENNSISHIYTLNISTIAVTGVSLADAGHELEVNHSLQLSATVSPSDATELARRGVRYYSRNTDIASVDELTGVVLGVAPGTANIYAECGGVESTNYEIEVYKVSATSVNITTADFTLSNNTDNGLTKQLEYEITVDRAGHTEPSEATISFVSSDESVATVNNSGLVTATGPGNAIISIQIAQEGQGLVKDSVNVTVDIVSKSLTINGGNSFYNDSTLTLTASIVPGNVTNNEIIWTVEPDNIVSLDTTTGGSVTLTPVDNEVAGTVTVTATNTGGASNSIQVTVADRPSEFTVGHHYIVGSALYNTGESVRVDGKSSWTTAKYAYHFTYSVSDPTVYEQYKGTIKFQAGDQFKYFIGADYWVPAWEQEEGWTEKGWHIDQGGDKNAFALGQMRFVKENDEHVIEPSDAADANIEVVEAGYYDLYAKLYKNADESLWYSLYIQKVPDLSVEHDEITMGLDESYQIKAHDWIGSVSYEIKSGSELITLSPTGLVTGKGATGDAVVTVSDERGQEVDVTFHLQDGAHAAQVIYLNANGKFDTDNVVPFVHSWGGEGSSAATDVKMTLVEGQTIVYSAIIPLDHNMIDFVRCPEGSTSINWELVYNQSKDQNIPNDGKDMFTMTGWTDEYDSRNNNYLDGSWSVFDSSHTYVVDDGGEDPLPPNNITLYFCDALEWDDGASEKTMSAYVWNTNKSDSQKAAWPGEPATYVGLDTDDNKVYSYVVDINAYNSIIFVAGTNQTEDIDITSAVDESGYKATTLKTGSTYNVEAYTYVPKAPVATYTVSFNPNGGIGTIAPVEDATSPYTLPGYTGFTAPENHHFVGWKVNNEGETKAIGASIELTDDVTLYAQWEENAAVQHTVSFNGNGATGEKASVNIDDGASYTLPDSTGFTAPTGKVFAGWALAANGAVIATATIDVTDDIELFAIWEDETPAPENITIYFTSNKGWSPVYCYAFKGTAQKAEWPGEAMTYVGVNDNNEDYFSFTFDKNSFDTVIFSNGNSGNNNQTVNIDVSSAVTGSAYYLENQITEAGDDYDKWTVGSWTYTEGMFDDLKVYYFTRPSEWGEVEVYAHMYKNETGGATTIWPGMKCVWIKNNEYGQGVFRFVFDSTKYDTVIFNNNNGTQLDSIKPSEVLGAGQNAFAYYDSAMHGWTFNPAA